MSEHSKAKDITPLFRRAWDTRELLAEYRPHHVHPNKALLFDLALEECTEPTGGLA